MKLEVDTNYVLDTFTLRREEDHSLIVMVRDSAKAEGTHVSYNDYIADSQESINQNEG